MTEKRFTAFTDFLGGTQTILDNGERKTLQELLDTMNELADENEQLKSRINDYNVALKRLQDLADRKLKENEQLKKQNKNLLEKLKFTTGQINYSENLRKMLDGDVE